MQCQTKLDDFKATSACHKKKEKKGLSLKSVPGTWPLSNLHWNDWHPYFNCPTFQQAPVARTRLPASGSTRTRQHSRPIDSPLSMSRDHKRGPLLNSRWHLPFRPLSVSSLRHDSRAIPSGSAALQHEPFHVPGHPDQTSPTRASTRTWRHLPLSPELEPSLPYLSR